MDYRQLNAVTKMDAYPLPRIDDLLDQLGSAKYFTTLDLAAWYWKIRVAEDSVEKTAFTTTYGLFEFRVMPFGLTNAPAVFQRLMSRVLIGLKPTGRTRICCNLHRRCPNLFKVPGGPSEALGIGFRSVYGLLD